MNHTRQSIVLLALVFLSGAAAHGFEAVSIGMGTNMEGISTLRFEIQKELGFHWQESSTGYFTLSLDGSADYWRNDDGHLWAFAAAPLLSYHFENCPAVNPFIEGGVGAAYITDTRIDNTDFGIRFQFEDILGFGIRFGPSRNHGVRFRLLHYSNGGLDDTNDGITFYTLSYHYRF